VVPGHVLRGPSQAGDLGPPVPARRRPGPLQDGLDAAAQGARSTLAHNPLFRGVGDGFSGSFVYGNTCGAGCSTLVDLNETDYAFASGTGFSTSVTNGTDSVTAFNAAVNIVNDSPLNAQDAALVSGLLGVSVSAGTLVDAFTLEGETPDAAFDINDDLIQGGVVEVVWASFDTALFSDTSFQALPPAIGSVDFAFFFVEEADSGVTLYDVAGSLAQVVPEPGASPLLVSTLVLLVLAHGLVRPRRA